MALLISKYLNDVERLQDITQNFLQNDDVVRHGADAVPGDHVVDAA